MERETHRLDSEQLLADRLAAAGRVQQEVDAVVSAAAEKRRVFLEWFVDHVQIEARGELERERRWADMRVASTLARTDRSRVAPAANAESRPWWLERAEAESVADAFAATG